MRGRKRTINIDPQLLEDCHRLGDLEHASLLLHRNACVGWLILVPHTAAVDWHRLDDAEHARVSRQIRALTAFGSQWFDAGKMNVATLGNVIHQMHVHIIARYIDDPCWPNPVWGHIEVWRDYANADIRALRGALCHEKHLAFNALE